MPGRHLDTFTKSIRKYHEEKLGNKIRNSPNVLSKSDVQLLCGVISERMLSIAASVTDDYVEMVNECIRNAKKPDGFRRRVDKGEASGTTLNPMDYLVQQTKNFSDLVVSGSEVFVKNGVHIGDVIWGSASVGTYKNHDEERTNPEESNEDTVDDMSGYCYVFDYLMGQTDCGSFLDRLPENDGGVIVEDLKENSKGFEGESEGESEKPEEPKGAPDETETLGDQKVLQGEETDEASQAI